MNLWHHYTPLQNDTHGKRCKRYQSTLTNSVGQTVNTKYRIRHIKTKQKVTFGKKKSIFWHSWIGVYFSKIDCQIFMSVYFLQENIQSIRFRCICYWASDSSLDGSILHTFQRILLSSHNVNQWVLQRVHAEAIKGPTALLLKAKEELLVIFRDCDPLLSVHFYTQTPLHWGIGTVTLVCIR